MISMIDAIRRLFTQRNHTGTGSSQSDQVKNMLERSDLYFPFGSTERIASQERTGT